MLVMSRKVTGIEPGRWRLVYQSHSPFWAEARAWWFRLRNPDHAVTVVKVADETLSWLAGDLRVLEAVLSSQHIYNSIDLALRVVDCVMRLDGEGMLLDGLAVRIRRSGFRLVRIASPTEPLKPTTTK